MLVYIKMCGETLGHLWNFSLSSFVTVIQELMQTVRYTGKEKN